MKSGLSPGIIPIPVIAAVVIFIVTTSAAILSAVDQPGRPLNIGQLNVSFICSGGVRASLTWNAHPEALQYTLAWKKSASAYYSSGVGTNQTSATVPSSDYLANYTSYDFQVTAVTASGYVDWGQASGDSGNPCGTGTGVTGGTSGAYETPSYPTPTYDTPSSAGTTGSGDTSGSSLPDLKADPIILTKSDNPAYVHRFQSQVRNVGNSTSAGFSVRWLVAGTSYTYPNLGLAAGASNESHQDINLPAGSHQVCFDVDLYNQIEESNNLNNQVCQTFDIATTQQPPAAAPSAPTGLKIVGSPQCNQTTGKLGATFGWNSASGASQYIFEIATSPDFSAGTARTSYLGASQTQTTDSDLAEATTYFWRLYVQNSFGATSQASLGPNVTTGPCQVTTGSSTTGPGTTPTLTKPLAPTSLTLNTTTCSGNFASVFIGWVDNSDNEKGFKVSKWQIGVDQEWVQVANVVANTRNTSFNNALVGATYWFTVGAYNDAGTSWYNDTQSPVSFKVECPTIQPQPPTGAQPPAATLDFDVSATPVSPSNATISPGASVTYNTRITYRAGSGAIDASYDGPECTGCSRSSNGFTTDKSATFNLTVSTLSSTPDGNYPITVTAVSGSIRKTATASVIVKSAQPPTTAPTKPAKPTNLTVNTTTCSGNFASIFIGWVDNSDNEQGFKVSKWQIGVDQEWVQVANVVANTRNTSFNNALVGATYWFTVGAYNDAGTSWYNDTQSPVSFKVECQKTQPQPTKPAPPTNVQASTSVCSGSFASVYIGWQHDGANVVSFQIEKLEPQEIDWVRVDNGQLGPNNRSFGWNQAQVGHEYFFRVGAANDAGVAWTETATPLKIDCPSTGGTQPPTTAGPDLIIEQVILKDSSGAQKTDFWPSQNAIAEIKVKNTGQVNTPAIVTVDLYLNSQAQPTCQTPKEGHANSTFDKIGGGGTAVISIPFVTSQDVAPKTLWALVDSQCRVDEASQEDNNAYSVTYKVNDPGQPPRPQGVLGEQVLQEPSWAEENLLEKLWKFITGDVEAGNFSIKLYKDKWNLISLPAAPVSANLANLLPANSYDNRGAFYLVAGTGDFKTTFDLNDRDGFYLFMKEDATINSSGTPREYTIYNLKSGLNLIGYPALNAKTIDQALLTIAGKYSIVQRYNAEGQNWQSYDPKAPQVSDFDQMEPGYGYFVNITDPAGATLTISQEPQKPKPGNFLLTKPAKNAIDIENNPHFFWNKSQGADYYWIYLGQSPEGWLWVKKTTTSDAAFSNGTGWQQTQGGTKPVPKTLAGGETYVWRVTAVNDVGTTWSEQFQFTVSGSTPPVGPAGPTTPQAPGKITAPFMRELIYCSDNKSWVDLSWDIPTIGGPVDRFEVFILPDVLGGAKLTKDPWLKVVGPLEDNRDYIWRVDIIGPNGQRTSSDDKFFATGKCSRPPVTFDFSADDFLNHIRVQAGDSRVFVPNWGEESLGKFLWGLSGCESGKGRDSRAVGSEEYPPGSGQIVHFYGLFQYTQDTWRNTNRLRGVSPPPDIFNGYAQIDHTIWYIQGYGASIRQQWPGCTDGVGREWTLFVEGW